MAAMVTNTYKRIKIIGKKKKKKNQFKDLLNTYTYKNKIDTDKVCVTQRKITFFYAVTDT